jgi:hypothetical protein
LFLPHVRTREKVMDKILMGLALAEAALFLGVGNNTQASLIVGVDTT